MKRIGLYGGSFDPVHLGHIFVAQAALEELALDRIYFIPAAQSPFKKDSQPANGRLRLQLLRLALAGRPAFAVDAQEIERGGVSFAVETLTNYSRQFPEARLHFLVGADQAVLLPQWHQADALARLAHFVVVPRPGEATQLPPPPFESTLLRGFPIQLSSSAIRDRVRRGLTIDHLVPPAVAEAVRNNQLYL